MVPPREGYLLTLKFPKIPRTFFRLVQITSDSAIGGLPKVPPQATFRVILTLKISVSCHSHPC